MLKTTIDKAIWSSVSFEEFLTKMKQADYEIRQGKYLAFRAPEQKHYTNAKTLGSYYTEEKILYRISQNRSRLKIPKNISREVRLYIDSSSYVSSGNRSGFEYWAKRNNLKEAARTFNYLSEHKLLNYEDFQNHISDMNASLQTAKEHLNQIHSELNRQKLIKKHCVTYRVTRQVVQDEKTAANPELYKQQHFQEYTLHQSVKNELKSLGVTKLPNPERHDRTISNLENEYSNTQKEIRDLQKQWKNLNTIEQNFQHLLMKSVPPKEEKPLQNEHHI